MGSTTVSRQSQWALVGRQFRKRKLAVASACLLMFLAYVAIWAPFLANDRPFYYQGINRFDYQEATRTARALLGLIADSEEDPKADLVRGLRLQFRLMATALPDSETERLAEFREEVETALKSEPTARAESLRALRVRWRKEFGQSDQQLVSRSHWPIVESLSWSDIWFITASLVVLLHLLFGRWIESLWNRWNRGISVHISFLLILMVPALASLGWWLLVPERVDRTPYKAGVLAAEEGSGTAPVLYESVVWPPIPYGLDEARLDVKSFPPIWVDLTAAQKKVPMGAWNSPHWLGTDEIGRDVLCRMIWGGRISLSVGIVAMTISTLIGIVIGAIAGYFRGIPDLLISRLIEIVICFPAFFLILTIVALLGPGIFNIMIVIGLTSWTGIARLVRGEFLRLVDLEFVLAGKSLGYSPTRLIFRHVLPNALAPVMVSATFGIAGAILTESALSFLGLGIMAPTPSWGGILASGRDSMFRAPWLIHFPGFLIFLTITSCNLVGETLRDASDPRLIGSRA